MEKMKMESANLTDKNIEKIATLFPNCITETAGEDGKLKKAINFDMLRAMLSEDIAEGDEAYEFTWVGKKAAIAEANRPIRKTLRPCKEESVDWDNTENLYIEGDNLEVLKLLQESYLGKVKMIYIDPPYNTGNDFIYRDDFAQTADEYAEESRQLDEDGNRLFKNTDSNGRFHSDWCSMIYSRLMLARNLLSDDGAIFISIGEQELNSLVNCCNEVFGEANKITVFSRLTKKSSNNGNNFSPCMDYVLVYAKILEHIKEYQVDMSDEIISRYNKKDEYFNERGLYQEVGLFMSALKHGGSNYPIECPDGSFVYPPNGQPWRWNKATFLKGKSEGRIVFKKTKRSPLLDMKTGTNSIWNIYTKVYLKERETNGMHPKNFSDEFQNTLATNELKKLGIPFDFAKPSSLIHFFSKLQTENNDVIMDFFSGSATTAHAVMQLNTEDGGHRKFIMVQLPETTDESSEAYKSGYKNICEIGKERIRRAGQKIVEEQAHLMNAVNAGDFQEGKVYAEFTTSDKAETAQAKIKKTLDTGFRVFKLDETNMEDVYYTPAETNQQMLLNFESNIKPDRTDLDLLFGCLLEWGLPLSMPYKSEQIDGVTVHTYNDGDLIACFDKAIPDSAIKTIAKRQPLRVVFRDDSFADSPSKINVSEIFKMISPDTRVKVI